MVRHGHRGAARGIASVLAAVMLAIHANAEAQEPGAVFASGDMIPGFGVLGHGGIEVAGLDAQGRVLVYGQLSTGDLGLFWGRPEGLTPIWRSGQTPHRIFLPTHSPNGQLVVAHEVGIVLGSLLNSVTVVEIAPEYRRILGLGDRIADGALVCSFGSRTRVNDAGTIALRAVVVPPGDDCFYSPHMGDAILVVEDGEIRVEVARGEYGDAELEIVDLLPDGTLIFSHGLNRRDLPDDVVASRRGNRRCPVRLAESEPPLCPEPLRHTIAANAAGEVLGIVRRDGSDSAYRTVGGELVPVVLPGDDIGDGFVVTRASRYGQLNDRGDVVMEVLWTEAGGEGVSEPGTVLFPAAGAPRIVGPAALRGFNDAGEVALHTDGAARWSDGEIEVIATTGDAAPGGGVFAAYGIEGASCLAADGRVAAVATSSVFRQGVVCADASGQHFIAGQGDAAPGGGIFENFFHCAFGGPDLYFVASLRSAADENGLFRVSGGGIERVVGSGDVDADGLPIRGLAKLSRLAVNEDGVVAIHAATSGSMPETILRSRPGQAAERIDLDPGTGRGADVYAVDYGVSGNGAVVATVHRPRMREWALVISDASRPRILLTEDDPRLTGGPFANLGEVLVSLQGAVFTAIALATGAATVFHYDLRTDRVEMLLPADDSFLYPRRLLDLTPGGDLLYEEVVSTAGGDPSRTAFFRLRRGQRDLLLRRAGSSDNTPVRLNDRGHVLSYASESPQGAARNALILNEPPAGSARCPGAGTSSRSSDGDGCQLTPREEPDRTGLVSLLLVGLALRLSRGKHGAPCRR